MFGLSWTIEALQHLCYLKANKLKCARIPFWPRLVDLRLDYIPGVRVKRAGQTV